MFRPVNFTQSTSPIEPQATAGASASQVMPDASATANSGLPRPPQPTLSARLGGAVTPARRETVTPQEEIPQRDKDLSTVIRATRNPADQAQGFSPVVLDAGQQAALKLTESGLTVDKDGFITSRQSGFRARIFQDKAGNIVLSFSGTDGTSPRDWNNNIRQAAGAGTNQYRKAMELAVNAKALFRDRFTQTTGHSLGGGLAVAAAAVTGVEATTFNAGGVNPATVRRFLTSRGEQDQFAERWKAVHENTTNYHVLGDAITHLQTDLDPARLLPDAVGKQVTLAAVDAQGVAHNQYTPGDVSWRERNRVYLHLAPAIMRGMGASPQA